MPDRSPTHRAKENSRPTGLLGVLERTGVRKGVFGENKRWFYIGLGLFALRHVRSAARRRPEILLREETPLGSRLLIANGRTTLDDPSGSPLPPKQ